MNQPFAGGWRFGDRPTSVEALYQPQAISNDFLKQVAAMSQDPQKKGLLDQALQAAPLTGLLESPGSNGWGNDQQQQAGGMSSTANGPTVMSEAGNPMTEVSSGGYMPNIGNALKGMSLASLPGLLGGLVDMQKAAPVYDMQVSGMNGFMNTDYGSSPTAMGAPTQAQSQALSDELALALMGYMGGTTGGGDYGGTGGVTGGSDTMGFGGVY